MPQIYRYPMNQIAREIDYVAKMQNITSTRKRLARQKNLALEPFNTPPEGNVPLQGIDSVAGAGTAGSSPIILAFTVPNGWDGLLKWIINQYTGTNFVNNSGNLEWALRINGLYIQGYNHIRSQFTGTTNGTEIDPGIPIKSTQLVEIICTVDPTFVPDGGSELIAGVSGYIYPNGIARTNGGAN